MLQKIQTFFFEFILCDTFKFICTFVLIKIGSVALLDNIGTNVELNLISFALKTFKIIENIKKCKK